MRLTNLLVVFVVAGVVFASSLTAPDPASTSAAPAVIQLSACIDTSLAVNFPENYGNWHVTVSGSLAFVSRGPGGVDVYDITNPSAPVLLDNFDSPGSVYDIEVAGHLAYLAEADFQIHDRGVVVLDVSDPANLQQVGLNSQPQTPYDVFLKDSLLFVADGTVPGKLWIMSLSNPTSPAVVGSYSTPHNTKSVVVVDTLAYLAMGQDGFAILNVADPTQPVLVGSYPGLAAAYDVFVADTVAYVANLTFGVTLLDISNPAAPTHLATYDTPGSANEVEVVNGVAHVADIDGGYLILDVTLPSQPSLALSMASMDRMLGLAVQGPRTFAADESFFTVFWFDSMGTCGDGVLGPCEECDDGNTLRGDGCGDCLPEPELVVCPAAGVAAPQAIRGVELVDSLLFVADDTSGLFIYNVRYYGPAPVVGRCNTHGSALRVAVSGSHVAVADGAAGLQMIDVSNPTHPTLAGRFATPTAAVDVDLLDTLAFVCTSTRLFVINVADPDLPESLTSVPFTGPLADLVVSGSRAFLAAGSTGVYVLDLSVPHAPVSIWNSSTPTAALRVFPYGDTLYVATGTTGVMSFFVSPSGSLQDLDVLDTQNANDVKRDSVHLYVADGTGGLKTYELSDSTTPVLVATIPNGSGPSVAVLAPPGRTYTVQGGAVQIFAWSFQGESWCGDGQHEPGEPCDDSNYVGGDGCTPCCQLEAPVAICGNGNLEYPEECDDGNLVAGDGCDPLCMSEGAVCGNGTIEYPELCDDGNLDFADGCNAQCVPGPVCGNGIATLPEECDDTNRVAGDGCDADCQYEHTCGDGNLELGEECDDGNTDPLDGCSAACSLETCKITIRGDVNGSRAVTSADIITMVNYVFKSGAHLVPCEAAGDVDCSGGVASGDIIRLVNYVFRRQGGVLCNICVNSPLAVDCVE